MYGDIRIHLSLSTVLDIRVVSKIFFAVIVVQGTSPGVLRTAAPLITPSSITAIHNGDIITSKSSKWLSEIGTVLIPNIQMEHKDSERSFAQGEKRFDTELLILNQRIHCLPKI